MDKDLGRRMTPKKLARRCVLLAACAPLVLLAGCPKENSSGAASSAQATAPPLTSPQAASDASQPVRSTAQSNDSAANAYKARQVINQAEQSYRSGVDNYKAGRLDAARADFDLAVDTMLASGLDLKSDAALSEEFERLLNQVNALEMDALKQGNGLSPTIEAAPLDEAASEATFAANPELTAKLKKELNVSSSDLPLVINDQVAGYINYFANSPSFHAHMLRSMERAGKYKEMMQKVLKEEGIPQDLIYLAVAESGFQPQALNAKSGAGGIWQFMPTGAYGLARNGWVDERFDPEKSTRAYAKYMKSVYDLLGDWYLAMAGYDWGPGNVQKAVMRTGYADFWELYRRNSLPAETKNYIPQVLAAVIMAKNPEKYGLDRMVPMSPVVFDTVPTDYAIDLRLVADLTDATVQEIVALNPSLLRLRTPPDTEFDLHVPVGTKEVYLDRLKSIPEEKRASWRFHTVRPGESLDGIASSLHSRASEIASANGLVAGESIAPGDELVIPVAAASLSAGHPQHYTTKRGDTLVTIADRFNVSGEDLRKWNHLSSNAIAPGRTLAVSEPVRLAPSMRARGKASRARLHAASSGGGSARTRMSTGDSQHAAKSKAGASGSRAGKSSAASGKTAASASAAKTGTKSLHGKKKAAR
jgi:membrane-bound lytic murein transglycosylase D